MLLSTFSTLFVDIFPFEPFVFSRVLLLGFVVLFYSFFIYSQRLCRSYKKNMDFQRKCKFALKYYEADSDNYRLKKHSIRWFRETLSFIFDRIFHLEAGYFVCFCMPLILIFTMTVLYSFNTLCRFQMK